MLLSFTSQAAEHVLSTPENTARFLGSHNPAQVKRNVLASFTSVLLLPVTIVPRAVGGVIMTGGNAAVQGIAMLNPQRWGGSASVPTNGYSKNLKEGEMLFETEDDEVDDEKVAALERKFKAYCCSYCEEGSNARFPSIGTVCTVCNRCIENSFNTPCIVKKHYNTSDR